MAEYMVIYPDGDYFIDTVEYVNKESTFAVFEKYCGLLWHECVLSNIGKDIYGIYDDGDTEDRKNNHVKNDYFNLYGTIIIVKLSDNYFINDCMDSLTMEDYKCIRDKCNIK